MTADSNTTWLKIDRITNQYFASRHSPWLRTAFSGLTTLGAGAVWMPLYGLALLFPCPPWKALIWTLILGETVGLLAIIILRYMTKRDRPIVHHKHYWFAPWNRYSFPSHHALRSVMIVVVVGTEFPALLPFLIPLGAGVCFSRIYLSKHYLSDVLTGGSLGAALAMASRMVT